MAEESHDITMNHDRSEGDGEVFTASIDQKELGFIKELSINKGLIGGGPGSTEPISTAHNEEVAFYGEVSSDELISGDDLCDEIDLTAGNSQNSDAGWLKFTYTPTEEDEHESEGRTLFVAKKAFRYDLSWDDLYDADVVYGGYYEDHQYDKDNNVLSEPKEPTIITIDGNDYIVRLLRTHITNDKDRESGMNNSNIHTDSEWHRLMYAVHDGSLDCSGYDWNAPDNVDCSNLESLTHDLGTGTDDMYNDEDLLTHYDYGDGSRTWKMEINTEDGSNRLRRGNNGVSDLGSYGSDNSGSHYGFRPTLELI